MEIISNELKKVLDNEKRPLERVLWSGTPIPKQLAKKSLGTMFFGIFVLGFSIFWVHGAYTQSNGESLFPLFGIPFVIVALGVFFSPLTAWLNARKTIYVITDQRAFILEHGKKIKVTNFNLEQIVNIEKSVNIDGSGDLVLLKEHSVDSDGDKKTEDKGFFAIRDVKTAESAIRKLCDSTT